MASLMQRGSAFVASKHGNAAIAGETITYTRKDVATALTITAILGRTTPQRQALADGRVNLDEEPADFLIDQALIDFGAGLVEPQRGDRITYGGRVWEVTPRDGEPCFRPDNQYRSLYRVRTIRVS